MHGTLAWFGLLASLASSAEPPDVTSPAEIEALKELAAGREAQGVWDRKNPGRWKGADVKPHEPQMTWQWTSVGSTARIRVPHGTTDNDWIEAVYVRDQDGQLVGGSRLSKAQPQVDVSFALPTGPVKLTAYASSMLHGYASLRRAHTCAVCVVVGSAYS